MFNLNYNDMNNWYKKSAIIATWTLSITIGLLVMKFAHDNWILYGNYTFGSFLVSVLIHLLPMVFVAVCVTNWIKRI